MALQGSVTHRFVPLVAVLVLAALTAACGLEAQADPEPDILGFCMDPVTEKRIDDDACGDWDDQGHSHSSTGSYFIWIDRHSGTYIPPVGQKLPVTSYNIRTPSPYNRSLTAGKVTATAPKAGGVASAIPRGGLGVSSGGGKSGGS